jgi:hypothetical protein
MDLFCTISEFFFENRSKGTILAAITQRNRAFYLVASDIICTFAGGFL